MFGFIWNTLIKEPIQITLLWVSTASGSLGLGIIALTIIIQLILVPLRLPSLKSAKKLKKLQPKIKELKETHSEDKMAFAKAQMELFKEHDVNPFGGILPTLLSLPIIIALYQVLLSTIGEIEQTSTSFLWIANLLEPDPLFILPILVAGSQFLLFKMMQQANAASTVKVPEKVDTKEKKEAGQEEMMQTVQTQMGYIFPVMSGVITASLPAGVGLYWLISALFAIMQQKVFEAFYKDGS